MSGNKPDEAQRAHPDKQTKPENQMGQGKKSGKKLEGDLIIVQPTSMYLFSFFLVSIFIILFLFLFLADYEKKEHVSGILVPDKGVTKIYAPINGIVSEISVSQGEQIKKGQQLFKVQIERNTSTEKSVTKELSLALDQQKESLQERLLVEEKWLESETRKRESNLQSMEEEARQLEILKALELDILKLESDNYKNIESLYQSKLGSQTELNRAHKSFLLQKQKIQNINLRLSNTQSTISNIKHELASIKVQFERQEIEITQLIADINIQKTRTDAETVSIVKAPIDGHISSVNIKPSQQLTIYRPALSIIPSNLKLEANLFVPPKAIGFLEKGQEVKIRYDAFPYQQFGVHSGTVTKIAKTVMLPRELETVQTEPEAVYKVTVKLDKQHITAYGSVVPLKSDMTITADIILTNRSLIEWLLDPIYSLRGGL